MSQYLQITFKWLTKIKVNACVCGGEVNVKRIWDHNDGKSG